MKKVVLLLFMITSFTMLSAQNTKVQSAFSYLRSGRLDKALENIEPAITHEKTMNDPKTWNYRGNIYIQIGASTDPNYQKLSSNSVQIAYDSYQKSIELDVEKEYEQKNMTGLYACAEQFYNKGVEFFNLKDYVNGLNSFEKTIKINNVFGKKDTLATYNAALCADLSGNKAKAKEHYISLVRSNFYQPSIYSSLSNLYKEDKDTLKAIKTIENGRKKFPESYELIIAEANIYLFTGDAQKAQNALNVAIAKDPTNATVHFAVGTNYDKTGDALNAEKSYKKAIELKPDYFDAIYNLGALYVNDAVAIMTKANALPLGDKNYDVLKKQADEQLNKAIPQLEKASDMQPNDAVVLTTLKDIYTRLSNVDKIKIINQKIANLKK
ncbi:MAG: tetratricopeptide repeat protein [Bacteroidetes bacterium]|nr:tetratricopeptide repeat protein [Bacteroidota bacterium]